LAVVLEEDNVDMIERVEQTGETTRFKAWWESAGLTVREVAGLLGCSGAHVSYLESGADRIRDPRVRIRIARALGCKVEEIFEPLVRPFSDT
jgi:transcriptional regulator with XRE-family HTH domain